MIIFPFSAPHFSCFMPSQDIKLLLFPCNIWSNSQGADIDVEQIRREKTKDLIMALAEAKVDAIITELKEFFFYEGPSEPTLLITADQVLHEGEIREKPGDADEACQFIKGYSKGHASTVGSIMVTNLTTGVRRLTGTEPSSLCRCCNLSCLSKLEISHCPKLRMHPHLPPSVVELYIYQAIRSFCQSLGERPHHSFLPHLLSKCRTSQLCSPWTLFFAVKNLRRDVSLNLERIWPLIFPYTRGVNG